MQHINEKSLQLRKVLGNIINKIVTRNTDMSLNKIENEYDIGRGALSRLINGKTDCKFITLWKFAEASGIKPSKLVRMLENELGEDFSTIDE